MMRKKIKFWGKKIEKEVKKTAQICPTMVSDANGEEDGFLYKALM